MVKPIKRLQIGKNGLTDEFMKQLESFFLSERMVKVNVLKSACRDKTELNKMAKEITSRLGPKYKPRVVGYVITISRFRKDV